MGGGTHPSPVTSSAAASSAPASVVPELGGNGKNAKCEFVVGVATPMTLMVMAGVGFTEPLRSPGPEYIKIESLLACQRLPAVSKARPPAGSRSATPMIVAAATGLDRPPSSPGFLNSVTDVK